MGQSTAQALRDDGWNVDLIAEREDARGLVEALASRESEGNRLLFPASEIASDVLSKLAERGWRVQRVTVYKNRQLACPDPDWTQIDEVVVTSPSCARALADCFPQLPSHLLLSPMGEPTAIALQELFPSFRLGPYVLDKRRTSHHG
ncbi:MAG: uroporphyrinogen-III synthase [Spirochaetales bacterium]|nr:uroporphyrinogen-III synthase [Spirochaetales bacterium]